MQILYPPAFETLILREINGSAEKSIFTTTPLAAHCRQCCFCFTWQSRDVWYISTDEVIGCDVATTQPMKQCATTGANSFKIMTLTNVTSSCKILKSNSDKCREKQTSLFLSVVYALFFKVLWD